MKIGGFLSNDSMFGKVMTKFGTMIILNVLFVVSCLPFITIGPALSALYYSILEMLQKEEEDRVLGTGGEINPFKVYLKGLRRDFFRNMFYWILFVGILIVGIVNIQVAGSWKGVMGNLAYVNVGILFIVCVIFLFGVPLHAACKRDPEGIGDPRGIGYPKGIGDPKSIGDLKGSFKRIVIMALQTAFLTPVRSLAVVLLYAVPLVLIQYDEVNKPLYAFIFCFFGCSLIAEMTIKLMKPAMTVVLAGSRAEGAAEKMEGKRNNDDQQ